MTRSISSSRLRDRLTDGWLVIPDVGLTEARDRQMDIVLAHALLYVGVSRAIAGLTVVGPRAIAERLRLEDRSAPQPSL